MADCIAVAPNLGRAFSWAESSRLSQRSAKRTSQVRHIVSLIVSVA